MNKTLIEAEMTIINRADRYGDSGKVHADIAAMWSVLLGCPVTAAQVMQCMIAVKLARLKNNIAGDSADSITDIAGYAALLGNLASDDAALRSAQYAAGGDERQETFGTGQHGFLPSDFLSSEEKHAETDLAARMRDAIYRMRPARYGD